MRRAGDILARCFFAVEPVVAEGARTLDIDRVVREFIQKSNAVPSFLGVKGMVEGAPDYPAGACVSINEEVIHGIPGPRALRLGDVVSIDIGVYYNGYHSDMARTFIVGDIGDVGDVGGAGGAGDVGSSGGVGSLSGAGSSGGAGGTVGASGLARSLVKVTEESFWIGLRGAAAGKRVDEISRLIQGHVEAAGYSVVRDYVGHGIGAIMHEPPQIPNYMDRNARRGARLASGMTLAIEPMVNAGGYGVEILPDKWTVVTADRSLSAHYENTVLVDGDEPLILSAAI
ncbi:MAG: M24 family metallopeptidase [Oscillospiraceae bacterium]|nr:M24 family metallopeptidase [Oscillospiraceae bacterium]